MSQLASALSGQRAGLLDISPHRGDHFFEVHPFEHKSGAIDRSETPTAPSVSHFLTQTDNRNDFNLTPVSADFDLDGAPFFLLEFPSAEVIHSRGKPKSADADVYYSPTAIRRHRR